MSEETTTTGGAPAGENPGKNLGIAGLVLAIVMIVAGGWLEGVLYLSIGKIGAILVIVLAVVALVISVMGMKKSKAAGFKSGAAVAGMIIAIVALVWLVIVFTGLSAMDALMGGALDDLQQAADDLQNLE